MEKQKFEKPLDIHQMFPGIERAKVAALAEHPHFHETMHIIRSQQAENGQVVFHGRLVQLHEAMIEEGYNPNHQAAAYWVTEGRITL